MADAPFDLEKAHRWFALELNNLSWDLFEAPDRSGEADQQMIHAAHAAYHHWQQVGKPINQLRALSLLAYVYAAVGLGDSAQRYGEQCLELSEQGVEEQSAFDRATALACAGRAAACAGNADEADQYRQKAGEAAKAIEDKDEMQVFEKLNG